MKAGGIRTVENSRKMKTEKTVSNRPAQAHKKEMPTMMAVSFMTLRSSRAFLLLVPFLKSAPVHQTVAVFRTEYNNIKSLKYW